MSEPTKNVHPLAAFGGLGGAAAGWELSKYCGASLWLPGIALGLLLVLFTKTPLRQMYFKGAIAATAAHITWFVVGSAVTGQWSANTLDSVVLTLGIAWLWLRPGLVAACFLGLIQAASLAYNVYAINHVPIGSASHRALTVHCLFRLLALVCLVTGYLRLRRERATPPPMPLAVGP